MEFLYNTGFGPRISIENTDTVGPNSYVVAMECGGIMEDPDIHYETYQLIRAESEKEAVEKYNKLNKRKLSKNTINLIIVITTMEKL